MKKKLLWALTLVLLALFPYQNAKAALVELSRSGWQVSASSAEETGEKVSGTSEVQGQPSDAIDGRTVTWWHTDYSGSNADKDAPHWIMFDLGSEQTFDAFNYVSRGTNKREGNGSFNEYILYTSNSAPNTSNIEGSMTPAIEGTFSYGSSAEHIITLNTSVTARYVMLYAVSTWGNASDGSQDNQFGHCVEFKLYKKDYFTDFGTSTRTNNDRKLNSFTLSDGANEGTITVNQASTSGAQIYFDKTSSVITLTKGEDITPTIDWTGWAMHSYLYVDFNADKTFTPKLGANGVPAEDSELIAYTYYNGYNHKGESTNSNTTATNVKNFTIPESIPNGTYRARYAIMWNTINADATSDKANGMCVVDFTIEVQETAPINERTITVEVSSSDADKGEVEIEGTTEKTIISSEKVTIKATAKEGYKFVKWTVDDVEVSPDATYTDATSGNKEYVAHFAALTATEKYAEYICTPGINAAGNTTFVSAATISEGVNIDNTTIEIGDLAVIGQKGVTTTITAKAGATFNLNLTYTLNWGDLAIFGMTQENSEMLYGPFEGSWVDTSAGGSVQTVLTNIANEGLTVDGTTVTYLISIPSTLNEGDIYVVRALTADGATNACPTGITEGGYIDFLFEIVGEAVPHTVKVVVTPSEGGSATINGEERTQIEASGIVSLSATPKDGYRFLSWTDNNGNLISENADFTKPIVADITYRANFVKVWDVTADSNNQEWGTVTIDGTNSEGSVDHATTITLTAEPTTGSKFIHWTLNGEPISTQNPFKTTILKDEVYQAVFDKDYPTVKLKYTGDEKQINRYLKSMTAVAGDLTTIAFDADSETSLPRVDAESSAFGNSGSSTATPTTTGALIDKTANPIKVLQETKTIALTFKQWPTKMKNGITEDSDLQLKYTQQAIFVDWNGDKDFADANEAYDKSSDDAINDTFASDDGYTRSITIPDNIETGVYRMRVVYHEPVEAYTSDWRDDFTETTSANIVTNGKVYDFAIEIVADKNYITFTAPGGTYFKMGETADVTLTYPLEGKKIYYTINGFDPDENSAVIDNGGTVALNTFNEGVVTIKAIAYDTETNEFCSSIYSAAYNISSHYTSGYVPKTTYNDNTTTIVGAAISGGKGIEDGTINHNFEQGQQTATTPISVAADATFDLDVTLNLKRYGIKIHRIDFTEKGAKGSIVNSYIGSYADEVNATEFESDLTTAGYTFTKNGDQYTVSIPVSIKKEGEDELSEGSSVVYRIIVTADFNNDALAYNYGNGEYVDFMFNVQPQSSITKLAGTATKDLNITLKTTDACYMQVGGFSQNLPTAQTLTIPASLNAAGEMDIQVVGAEIEKMDIEVLEIGTNVLLPDVDYLGEVTLKSSADFSATTISHASVLPEDGINVVVEKEIFVPYEIDGKMPTYFNFLSMPFDFDPGVNIEFYNPNTSEWEPATIEEEIRVLTYKSGTRANGQAYYNQTWNTFGGTGGLISANKGFVLVGNRNYGDAEHKMKLRFKSYYAEQVQDGQGAVTRETIYTQDGSAKTITANRYRKNSGETHPLDADWQHIGSPYLTHSDGIDYVLYYHDGYKYVSVGQTESPTISAFQSVMFQANLGDLSKQDIIMTPLSIGAKTKAANGVYGRANLAINDDECVKIVLKDDASENFVVNEDAWYMAPTANVFSTMSVNVAGSEASISVQPEPTELPLTVYAGAKAQQTISLSRYDGEVNIFLKDAVTDETVCLNDEDYTFTATPYSTIADRFTVSMIEPTGITESVAEATIKAVVTADGIKLFGTEEGDQVSLYTANGMMITNAVAQDGVTTIPTTATGVIIIKVAEETIKVVK